MTTENFIGQMKENGFTLRRVDKADNSFMFTSDEWEQFEIVLEVYSNAQYHFYWTKPGMLGFMDSGLLNDVYNEEQLKYNYTLFRMQAEAIRGKTIYD